MAGKMLTTALVIISTGMSFATFAAEVRVLSASGMREVVGELQPQMERITREHVIINFGEAGDLSRRIQGGEAADVIVLPRVVMDQVSARQNVVGTSVIDLAQSSMGIGVRASGPKPDIGSAENFKRVLLAANSIVVTDPASGGVTGVYIAEVFRRLGVSDQLAPKLRLTRGQRNAEFVAKGDADIAIQLSNEIRMISGIEFLPLPKEFEQTFVFSVGLSANAKEPDKAKAILELLAGSEAAGIIRSKGMDQPARQ